MHVCGNYYSVANCKYKLSVIGSFDPPKVEKRWRYYHAFDFFGPLNKSVVGSIPGATPVPLFLQQFLEDCHRFRRIFFVDQHFVGFLL